LKKRLPLGEKAIRFTYRKIVLGGTTGRRAEEYGGLYLFERVTGDNHP
jgi:hypothetical protein